MLIDDGSTTVSMPELPLLAVLPGTGGVTRLMDKRKVRHDHADVFCTTSEGFSRDCPDQTDSSKHVTLWDGSNYKRAA